MTSKWFVWQRESAIHPVFVCLEGGFTKFRKDIYSIYFPDTYLIFEKNLVKWIVIESELIESGKIIAKKLLNKDYQDKVEENFLKLNRELLEIFKKIKDLSELDDKKLQELYNQFHELYARWWGLSLAAEEISEGLEFFFNKKLGKNLTNDQRNILTSCDRETFNTQEENDLARIALLEDKKEALADHSSKYHWLLNNYLTTKYLGPEHFMKRLKDFKEPKKIIDNNIQHLIDVKEQKSKLIKELNLDEETQRIIELINEFTYFQDVRKRYNLEANYYLDIILEEIGKRFGYSLTEMKYTFPMQIDEIFAGKDLKQTIKDNMFYAVVDQKPGLQKILNGKEGKDFGEKLLDEIYATKTDEIKGNPTYPGKVQGKVRITLYPDQLHKLKQGEILVTSMTSPEFVVGLKKVKGLITDQGGLTCHAAIISREFKIPTIIGTKIATKVLKDGDLVEIDAEKGIVKVLRNEVSGTSQNSENFDR